VDEVHDPVEHLGARGAVGEPVDPHESPVGERPELPVGEVRAQARDTIDPTIGAARALSLRGEVLTDFEAFFADEYGDVLRTVALALGDRTRAEEVTQEAFARAFRRWRTVSRMDRPAAWVYVVALNAERSRFRKDSRLELGRERDDHGAGDPSDPTVARVLVAQLLDRLPPRQRAAIVLRYLSDLTVPEIARALGCAEGTVKSGLHDALRNLRHEVEGSDA
jgi:RNA polymerase sigma-70 factor (ECF subfamily)